MKIYTQYFYDAYDPKYIIDLYDSLDEAFKMNRYLFKIHNLDWTDEEIDKFFLKRETEIRFKRDINRILEEK